MRFGMIEARQRTSHFEDARNEISLFFNTSRLEGKVVIALIVRIFQLSLSQYNCPLPQKYVVKKCQMKAKELLTIER
jgi:hypothetical protein